VSVIKGFTLRIVAALIFTIVLSAILANLPLNNKQLGKFSATRIHEKLTEQVQKLTPANKYKCSIVVIGESLAETAEQLEILGPIGKKDATAQSCRISVKSAGWLLNVEMAGETIKPIMVDLPNVQWSALLPAILAIALAIATRKLITSLFIGVALGAALMVSDGSFAGSFHGLTIGTAGVLKTVLLDDFHFWIFLFTFSLIGMVNVSTASGGMLGLANIFARLAKNTRSTQLATAFLGLAVFFDDYSNTVVVGGCMRPLTDRMKISREKLAYIVDCTAAPIAGLALISTWIGYEVGIIGESMKDIGLEGSPYAMFISTIPYRFYCILTIIFVLINIISRKEFGSMKTAQQRSLTTGEVLREGSVPLSRETVIKPVGHPKAINAFLPVLAVILITLLGMALNGAGVVAPWSFNVAALGSFEISRLFTLENNYLVLCQDGTWVLAMASVTGSILAFILGMSIGKANGFVLIKAWFAAGRMLLLAFSILILAWSIGHVNSDLGTGAFLVSSLADTIAPWLLPVLIFLLAAFISFSTGSSWGTMAVLLPAAVPLAYHIGGTPLMIISVGAVLDGSIFGDHCSPLSDTTIMSSIAAGCDHLDHVKTQIPYALVVAAIAIFIGYALATIINPVLAYAVAMVIFWLVFKYFGKNPAENTDA